MNNAPEVYAAFMLSRIGPTTRIIIDLLGRNFWEWIPTERIIDAVYGDREDGGPDNPRRSINVILCRDRPAIRKAGYLIEVSNGGPMGGSWRRLVRA